MFDYIRDPSEIYRRSFEIVRSESSCASLPPDIREIAVRLVHSCGMPDILDDFDFSDSSVTSGISALGGGCSIWCDVESVRSSVTTKFLRSDVSVYCSLNDERVVSRSSSLGVTRSACAVDFWDSVDIAVIGNAPTALFRLLERIELGELSPSLVIATPVGFVGAEESKRELAVSGIDYMTVHGRRGGSAMAASLLNGLLLACGDDS